jgi:5-methylcytosine-specific restriction endonuclease McrA
MTKQEKWAKKNPAKVALYKANYIKNNRKKVNAANTKWRLENKERASQLVISWQKNNRPKMNSIAMKRHAAKLKRTPAWLTDLHIQQIQMFYDVACSLKVEFGIEMAVDHIVPLQGKNVSGLHVPWNLQVITKSENSRKGNR